MKPCFGSAFSEEAFAAAWNKVSETYRRDQGRGQTHFNASQQSLTPMGNLCSGASLLSRQQCFEYVQHHNLSDL